MDFQLSLASEGVGSAYPDQPLAAAASDSVGQVLQLLRAQRTGAVLICDGPRLVGILTERDALKLMARGANLESPVRDVMSKDLVVAEPQENVDSALQKMHSIRARHLPVVSDGKLVGMISIRDLLEVDDADQRQKATFLNELVTYSPDYET